MALKKVKPDPRFTEKRKAVALAHARGTDVKKAEKQAAVERDIARIKKGVVRPVRDAEGRTAIDRQIAENKAKLDYKERVAANPPPDSIAAVDTTSTMNAAETKTFMQRLIGMSDEEIRQVRVGKESGEMVGRTGITVSPTAAGLQTVTSLINSLTGKSIVKHLVKDPIKFRPGINAVAQEVAKVAPNSWSQKVIETLVKKAFLTKGGQISLVKVTGIIAATVGTYAWNGHLKLDNVIGGYKLQIYNAYKAGNDELALQLIEEADEYLNPTWYEAAIDWIPGPNIIKTTFFDGLKETRTGFASYKQLIRDAPEIMADEAAYWDGIEADRTAQKVKDDEDSIARYEASQERSRQAAAEADKEKSDRIKKDAEERRRLDLELAIEKDKLYDDYVSEGSKFIPYDPPSALNFGLI